MLPIGSKLKELSEYSLIAIKTMLLFLYGYIIFKYSRGYREEIR